MRNSGLQIFFTGIIGLALIVGNALGQDNAAGNTLQAQLERLEQAAGNNATSQTPGNNAASSSSAPAATNNPAVTNTAAPTASASPTAVSQTSASPPTVGDQAFVGMTNAVLPLSSDQIKALHALFNVSQQAAATYPGVPPRPTSSAVIVNLSPGATPPIIRLRSGYVSSLVFVDSSGEPWPISAYDIGDPKAFNVVWDKKSNVLLVQALSQYQNGNLAVLLSGYDTPVMVTLMSGQKAVDYRVELRVPALGPNANATVSGLPAAANPVLLDVLNGIPPQGSKAVMIEGCSSLECQGWLMNNKLYLRTDWTLLSPGWISVMNSPDGTHAYELQSVPVLLVSKHGKMQKIVIDPA